MREQSSSVFVTANAPPTAPSGDPPNPPPPRLSLRPIYITLILIAGMLLGAGGLAAYQEYLAAPAVNSFEECTKARGSKQLLTYPGICISRDGQRFTQSLPEKERQNLQLPDETGTTPPSSSYTCPETEWVDCMPRPNTGTRPECSEEYLTWAQANCPGFRGAAF